MRFVWDASLMNGLSEEETRQACVPGRIPVIADIREERFMHNVGAKKDKHVLTDAILSNYINSIALVSAYCTAVNDVKTPGFEEAKAWKADFEAKIAVIKGNALYWNASVMPMLLTVPGTVVNYDSTFKYKSSSMQSLLKALIKQEDPKKRKTLADLIGDLIVSISENRELVSKTFQLVKNFYIKLTGDYASLQKLMETMEGEDKELLKKMKELKNDIADLEKEAQKSNKWFSTASACMGASLAIGAVGISLFITAGSAPMWLIIGVLAVGGAGTLASVVGMIVEGERINKKANNIKDKTDELTKKEKDIAVLEASMAVIKSLCDSCDAAQTALQNIGHVWSDLGTKMDALKARILDEQIKIETSEYEAMLEELTHVDAQWAEIVEVARILADIGVFEDDTDYHMAV